MINYRIIGSIKIIVINVALIAGLSFSFRTGGSEFPETMKSVLANKNQVLDVMELVADWQIAHQSKVKHHDLDWTNATLYIGMMELARLSENAKYKEWLIDMGWKYQWQPFYRMYLADDIAVSQMYLEMYKMSHDRRMLEPTMARTEWTINHPSVSNLNLNYADYS